MGIDLIFLALLAWYAYKGYRKGVVQVLLSSLAFVIATLCALKLSGKIATYFFKQDGDMSPWVPMLSFVIVFAAVVFIAYLVSKTIDSGLKKVKLGWLNRLSGMALYALLVAFFFSTIFWMGDKVGLINPDTKAKSVSYPLIAPIAPWGFEVFGTILPFIKSSYAELNGLLDQVNQKLPQG